MDIFYLSIAEIKFYLGNNHKNGSKITVQLFILKAAIGKHGAFGTISS